MTVEYIKRPCPNCGRMVTTLWTWKSLYDSCKHCNPHVNGRSPSEMLRDLEQERRKHPTREEA